MSAPRAPITGNWVYKGRQRLPGGLPPADKYESPDGILVLSAYEIGEGHSGLIVPHFHISVSYRSTTATAEMMRAVRHDFHMEAADEDNHGQGVVRHLWLEAHRAVPAECHCKNEDPPRVEGERAWRP
jgi:hypothetical protein